MPDISMIAGIYFQPKLTNQQRCRSSVYQLAINVLQYKQWYECRVVIQYKQWYDRGLPYLAACSHWVPPQKSAELLFY